MTTKIKPSNYTGDVSLTAVKFVAGSVNTCPQCGEPAGDDAYEVAFVTDDERGIGRIDRFHQDCYRKFIEESGK